MSGRSVGCTELLHCVRLVALGTGVSTIRTDNVYRRAAEDALLGGNRCQPTSYSEKCGAVFN